MTNAPTPAKLELRFPGHTVAVQAGTVLIGVTWIREGVYRVSVNHGGIAGLLGAEVDGASYADEADARTEARRMVRAYAELGTPQRIAEVHGEAQDLAETWLKRYGPEARARAVRYERRADALMPLGARAVQASLAARVTADLAAAAA